MMTFGENSQRSYEMRLKHACINPAGNRKHAIAMTDIKA